MGSFETSCSSVSTTFGQFLRAYIIVDCRLLISTLSKVFGSVFVYVFIIFLRGDAVGRETGYQASYVKKVILFGSNFYIFFHLLTELWVERQTGN